MADISGKIVKLIHNTDAKERFNVARDIGWQIERGLFNCRMEIEKKYDPNEIKNQKNAPLQICCGGWIMISLSCSTALQSLVRESKSKPIMT